jgi:hypothetical protein
VYLAEQQEKFVRNSFFSFTNISKPNFMNIIQECLKNKDKYFFSIKDNVIMCGGRSAGKFYGLLEVKIDEEAATIYQETSNGISESITLTPEQHVDGTNEYIELVHFQTEISEYLKNNETLIFQDLNRETLLRNTLELLPSHSPTNAL